MFCCWLKKLTFFQPTKILWLIKFLLCVYENCRARLVKGNMGFVAACGEEQILFTTPYQVCSWMCTASVSMFIHLCLQVVHDVLSPAVNFFIGVNSKDICDRQSDTKSCRSHHSFYSRIKYTLTMVNSYTNVPQ